ncbi:MAG: Nramp family divalent metal transporter [Ignavibacteria bacterium]|nr:Nramp family divalent metal transporter [Ignavibacteria bacterium]
MKNLFKSIGPGFIVAATGVGAGDMVASTIAGGKFGLVILWVIVFGALLKYVLNEGIARWQYATGSTLLEGWIRHLPKIFSYYFIGYLFVWSFIVGGALTTSCGLALNAMFPVLSIEYWAVIQAIIGFLLIYFSRYSLFENIMKVFVVIMFLTFIITALILNPDWIMTFQSLVIPSIPEGSSKFLLSVIGGVGGSLTILSYSYWIREKKWNSPEDFRKSKIDLSVAYIFTGLFCLSIAIIASGIHPDEIKGERILIGVADKLTSFGGVWLKWIYLLGFWCAVFSSLIGVLQGIPYMYADFIKSFKKSKNPVVEFDDKKFKKLYNSFLIYITFAPLILQFINKPSQIIFIYTIIGALFMPFLAFTLLYMNNSKKLNLKFPNPVWINLFLIITLLLFGYLSYNEIIDFLK